MVDWSVKGAKEPKQVCGTEKAACGIDQVTKGWVSVSEHPSLETTIKVMLYGPGTVYWCDGFCWFEV